MVIQKISRYILYLLWIVLSTSYAQNDIDFLSKPQTQNLLGKSNSNQEFLDVHDAFRISVIEQNSSYVVLRFISAENYYLYREKLDFKVTPQNLFAGEIVLPQGIIKNDEFFGETEVYYEIFDVKIDFNNPQNIDFNLDVHYQGCAEKGLCYPPQVITFSFGQEGANANIGRIQDITSTEKGLLNTQTISFTTLALFFIAGIGLAFTPCVLPMVPIISVVVIREQSNLWRKLALALAYVIAMALCFAGLGALMGIFGAELNLQARLQSAWILVPFATFFAVMALAMFGLFELQLPQIISKPLNKLAGNAQGGTLLGSAILGLLSALLVSPCISAPLAAILVYISATGDAQGGGLNLLVLGLGMGVPLIIFSVGGGFLLPKAGNWLITVRDIFGILLLATTVWLIERIIPSSWILPLWALLAGFSAFIVLRNFSLSAKPIKLVRICCALLLVGYGVVAVIGGIRGGDNPLKPLTGRLVIGQWQNFDDVAQFENALKQAAKSKRAVVVDWYADWCISCKVIERDVLANPVIAEQLDNYLLLRFDITKSTTEQRRLLDKYQLFGPPAILFFAYDGKLIAELNVIGEINFAQFRFKLEQFAQILSDYK